MIKAVITDLDRTLLRTDKTISQYTAAVLHECHNRGILLMAATARPQRAVIPYQKQIGFEAVILPNKTVENGIPPSNAEMILKKIIRIPGIVISIETGAGIFSNLPIPEWNSIVFNRFPALPTESILYKILLSSEKDIR